MVHTDAFTASSVATSDGTRRITLAGEPDLASAPRLTDERRRAAACRTRAVVLDLSELTFMDCAGLRAVFSFSDRARARGWDLRIVSPPAQIARLLRGFDTGNVLWPEGSDLQPGRNAGRAIGRAIRGLTTGLRLQHRRSS
jgi:anti-anti-sigma factor